MNSEKILNRIIEFSFYLLFFLVPLIMTPWNFELFEYNKMMLVYALTVIIVGAWLTRSNLVKRIIFQRTPFDIPIILFFVFQFFNFLFSIDRHTSLFGYYSRFHGGLLSTTSYILLYYALVSNLDKRKTKNCLLVILFSGFLVSLYGILEHFGIDAKFWVQDVQNRVFSTLGQPNWLAAWLAAVAPISLAFGLRLKIQNLIFYFLFFIFYLCLVFTKSRSGIPAAGFSLLVFFFFLSLPKIRRLKKIVLVSLISLISLITLISLIAGISFLFKNPAQDLAYIFDLSDKVSIPMHRVQDPGSESGDIRKVVWRGAFKIFKAYPLFGSGVETFAYSYYQFRPVEHNYVSEWDFLYNKAHNEYFNFLATTGAFGFGSYILLIGWVVVWNIKKIFNLKFLIFNQFSNSKNQISKLQLQNLTSHFPLLTSLFAGWLSILITNFFGFSVVAVALLFFLFPAFIYILSQEGSSTSLGMTKPTKQYNNITIEQSVISLIILLGICCLEFGICQMWYADTLYAAGNRLEKQGLYPDAYQKLQQAVKLNSGEPVFKDELAYIDSALAVAAVNEKQNDLVPQFTNEAIAQSDFALKISPRNMNFYRTRARVFYNLARIDPKYAAQALAVLQTMNQMAPTDAKIVYNLGLIYYQLGQKNQALEILKKALVLRPTYFEVQNAIDIISKEK